MAKKPVVDPWKSFELDYEKIMKEFGIKPFRPVAKELPEPHLLMRRGIVFGHRDFDTILNKIKRKKPFVMMTGLMPSGKFHIGHAMLAEQIIYYQKHGGRIYLCVADIEAYNIRRTSLEKLRKTAIEEYLLNYIALGLKPKNCDFYFQSNRSLDGRKASAYSGLIGRVSRRATFNELRAIYGELSPGKIISVFTQVADILHPELDEFEGIIPVLVPVGIDQDPHLRLTRDVAFRMKRSGEIDLIPPASTYHEFMPGLKGGKMSSSDPNSYIALTDDPKTVERKIMKYAFSGGRGSVKEHREKGGNPDVDVAYQMLYMMFEPDDKKIRRIHDDYRSGALLTGELKQYAIEKIAGFLEKHQTRMKKAKDRISEFLDRG